MVAVLRVEDRVKNSLGDRIFKCQWFGMNMKKLGYLGR